VTADDTLVTDQRSLFASLPSGLEPMRANYHTDRTFRPERLHVTWVRRDGGEWLLTDAKAVGPIVKKDGADAKVTASYRLVQTGNAKRLVPDCPEWARALVEAYTPERQS
jgi:hypothetical protein